MPLIVSYLIIPLVFLLLAVNFYFRFKMIKQYKFLREKNIQIDPKVMMNKQSREAFITNNYPMYKVQLEEYSASMTNLIRYVVLGFSLILLCFLYIYFTR